MAVEQIQTMLTERIQFPGDLMPVTEAVQILTEETVVIQQDLVAMVQEHPVQAALEQEQEPQDQEAEQQDLVAMVQEHPVQAALEQEQLTTKALNKKQRLKQPTEKKQRLKQRMAKRK